MRSTSCASIASSTTDAPPERLLAERRMADMTVNEFSITSAEARERANKALDARRLRKRYAAERRFRLYGVAAIAFGLFFLAWLFGTLIVQGIGAFQQTQLKPSVELDAGELGFTGTPDNEA